MAFARDGLVVNEQRRRHVSKTVQTLPVLPAKRADGLLIARQRENHKDD